MGGGLLRQKRRDTVTEGKPGEKCRDCSDAATSQVAPGAPTNWKRQKGSYPGGKMALRHLDFGSLTSTTVRTELCCFKLPSLWYFVMAAPGRSQAFLLWLPSLPCPFLPSLLPS